MVEICVEKSLLTILDMVFDLQSRDGSATGNRMQYTTLTTLNQCSPYSHYSAGLDYNLTRSTITLSANDSRGCFSVEIKDDDQFEKTENFFVDLSYSGTSGTSSVTLELNEIEIKIGDNDGMPGLQ